MASSFLLRMYEAVRNAGRSQEYITSQYFDEEYYRVCNPDVAEAGVDLFSHFLNLGIRELRHPNPNFHTAWYLSTYADALASNLGPVVFHHRYGRRRGYGTSPTGDDKTWLSDSRAHFQESRVLCEYISNYKAIVNSDLFDPDYYIIKYNIRSIDPIDFFIHCGAHLGHNPSNRFDAQAYVDANFDVKISGINPFMHYSRFGRLEGRPLRRRESLSSSRLNLVRNVDQLREDREAGLRLAQEGPLISVIVPVYNSDIRLLDVCIKSILDSSYPKIELVIVDDCSKKQSVRDCLSEWSERDPRVVTVYQDRNSNISAATNAGIAVASGSMLVFVDHDDEVSSDAILSIVQAALSKPDIDAWYSDQVKCDEKGEVIDHFFKPDWSPFYLLGAMYVGHILAVKTSLVRNIGGFDSAFDGVQDFELMLRISEQTDKIGHISRALYKWRAIAGSLAAASDAKDFISERQSKAVQDHIVRSGRSWVASSHPALPHRVVLNPGPYSHTPSVSIIIPSKDQGEVVERCLASVFGLTDYPDFEVIVVDNGTVDPIALDAFGRFPIKRVDYPKTFNFSEACNVGADSSRGELVLFLNNDTEVLYPDWLRIMAMYFEDKEVGAVGPVLLYPDRRVQHAGIVLGARGTADHVMRFQPEGGDGYAGSLACTREVSGVTAACLMMRRDLFEAVGRFSLDFTKHYQDVDLCLKIRETGKRILSIGNTQLLHHESLSRKADGYDLGDRAILIDRWHEVINRGDPYYNGAFELDKLNYGLRF